MKKKIPDETILCKVLKKLITTVVILTSVCINYVTNYYSEKRIYMSKGGKNCCKYFIPLLFFTTTGAG